MPKLKCPACGSSETVKIIYGMPTFEASEAEERGELVLGGCCVSEEDPNRVCKACGRQFGGNSSYLKTGKDVTSFFFFVGGYFGTSHHVYIENMLLKYARTPGGLVFDIKEDMPQDNVRDDMFVKEVRWPDEQWQSFIDDLTACNVEHWNEKYNNNDVCDGTQWSLEIVLPGRPDIVKSGSNAYPPAWKKFLKVLKKFAEEDIG